MNIFNVCLYMVLFSAISFEAAAGEPLIGEAVKSIKLVESSFESNPPNSTLPDKSLYLMSEYSRLASEVAILEEKIRNLEMNEGQEIDQVSADIGSLRESLNKYIESAPRQDAFTISTILLTSVAILVTVLGVGIAILSVFGYREIKEVSEELARDIATKSTKKKVEELIPEMIESQLIKLFEERKIDEHLYRIFMKISMRGIRNDGDEDDG